MGIDWGVRGKSWGMGGGGGLGVGMIRGLGCRLWGVREKVLESGGFGGGGGGDWSRRWGDGWGWLVR